MGPTSIPFGFHQSGHGCQGNYSSIGDSLHRTNEECGIREVWAHNMGEEFKTICQVCLVK